MSIYGWDILVTMALCMKKHYQNIFAPILIAEYGIIKQTGKNSENRPNISYSVQGPFNINFE